jgi:hypothetical protein
MGMLRSIDIHKNITWKKWFHHHSWFGTKVFATLNSWIECFYIRYILEQLTDIVLSGRFDVDAVPCFHFKCRYVREKNLLIDQ